jgi:3-oxoadipate enol-lactonase
MPSVTVNKCEIYYEQHGVGPDLVFVHGETHGINLFDDQIPHFSRRFRCLSYDRRGHGKSEVAPYGYSLWNQTNDLAALLDRLEIRRAVVVAVAMSTPLAVTYTLHHPERVRGLVLASWYELDGYPLLEQRRRTHAMSFGDLHLMMLDKLRTIGRQGLEDYMEREYETVFPIFPRDKQVRQRLIRLFAQHPPGHYVASGEYYTSLPNLVPEIARIGCPILGVCGDQDPSPDRPELLQHLPNFKEVWIAGARRFTMMEFPAAFNHALDEFLSSLPP